jgi:hypothetical protein
VLIYHSISKIVVLNFFSLLCSTANSEAFYFEAEQVLFGVLGVSL